MSDLRKGYTTGSCALAATKAACITLFEGKRLSNVKIITPNNTKLLIKVFNYKVEDDTVSCCVFKDGGDDIDATNGLAIYAYLKKTSSGINIKGGQGVGKVTKKGLRVAVGHAAINPVPYQMIEDELNKAKQKYNYNGGLEVSIVVPKGEEVAHKTFNGRLGIEGGISILGTTGIVEPMSEKALIETIKVEIDYYLHNVKSDVILLSPGNYGQAFCKDNLGLNIDYSIKYSNFIGETLDYLKSKKVKKILVISHIGKLIKIAAAIMNTHSKYADGRNEIFCAYAALNEVDYALLKEIMKATTSDEIDLILKKSPKYEDVYQSIEKAIQDKLNYRLSNEVQIEFIGFSLQGGILVKSSNANGLIKQLKEDIK